MWRYKYESCKIKKVDPVLQLYSGIPLTIINNDQRRKRKLKRYIGIYVHLKKVVM